MREKVLLKKDRIAKQFVRLADGPIPFPIHEVLLTGPSQSAVFQKPVLIHYSRHNWERLGSGNLTVCLHGLNGSRLLFADFLSVVDTYYAHLPVLTLDLLGHGLSSCPRNRRYSLEIFLDQLDALLAHLQIAPSCRLTMVGFSLGGAIAVGFANRHPCRIAKMVLISPAGFVPFHEKKKVVDAAAADFQGISPHVKLVRWVPSCILNPIAKMVFRSAFKTHNSSQSISPDLPPEAAASQTSVEHQVQMDRLIWQSFVKKGTVEATMSIVKNFPLFNMTKTYDCLSKTKVGMAVPVLLVWGELDRVNPIGKCGEKVKSFFKNSFLLKVEGAGHVVISEQPSLVISSIVSFLQTPDDFQFLTPTN